MSERERERERETERETERERICSNTGIEVPSMSRLQNREDENDVYMYMYL